MVTLSVKKGTSSTISATTTPSVPKAAAPSVEGGMTAPRVAWAPLPKPAVAPSEMRKSMFKARASNAEHSMVSGMRGLNMSDALTHPGAANPNVYNPSLGPLPPTGNQWGGTAMETEMTADTYFKPVFSTECVKTRRTVRDFRKGEVIALPFHVPNMNPRNGADHPRVRITCEGPAFTKRRMFVILWINQLDMYCLPLYSFEGKGLVGKKDYQKDDYVCLRNKEAGSSFKNEGNYKPVVFESYDRRRLTDETTVHLTEGVTVDPRGHISFVGRLDEASHKHLLGLWQDRVNLAKSKPWGTVPVKR